MRFILETLAASDAMAKRGEVRSLLYLRSKRIIDIFGSVLLLLVFSPALIVVAILLLRQGGSVIYCQTRIGRGGRPMGVLKFRTMVPDAESVLGALLSQSDELRAEWESSQKLREDPRITQLGLFLRKTSIDELPQLFNVLKGEMSLVGPRPIVMDELKKYGSRAFCYTEMTPGITGLWQVSGRSNTDYGYRVDKDCEYYNKASLLLDFFILVRTLKVVLLRDGAY